MKELRRRLHDPIPVGGTWLRQVVGGHVRYYGVPMKSRAIGMFRFRVGWRLVPRAGTAQSHRVRLLGTDAPAHRAVAAPRARLSPVSPEAAWRCHLRQEPDAVMPHVRIRGGGNG
jgi:hypothetical protein